MDDSKVESFEERGCDCGVLFSGFDELYRTDKRGSRRGITRVAILKSVLMEGSQE